MKRLKLTPLDDAVDLIAHTRMLPRYGPLCLSQDGLLYLDIDNNYIHYLYPLFKNFALDIRKPNYFAEKLAGAHISVIYPEENVAVNTLDLGTEHAFEIIQPFAATLGCKRYYGFTAHTPSLRAIREKHGLSAELQFKNHWITFHVTVATSML
jgi:hypothetical protein